MIPIFERFIRECYPQFAEALLPEYKSLEQVLAGLGIGGDATRYRTASRVRQAQKRGRYSGFLSRRMEDRREAEVERRIDAASRDYGYDW